MKNISLLIAALFFTGSSLIAEVNKNTRPSVPAMTTAQRTSLIDTAPGLMVYDSDSKSYWLYQSNGWQQLATVEALIPQNTGNPVDSASPHGITGKGNAGMFAMPAHSYLGFTEAGNQPGYAGSYSGNAEDVEMSIMSINRAAVNGDVKMDSLFINNGNMIDAAYKTNENGRLSVGKSYDAQAVHYCICVQGVFPSRASVNSPDRGNTANPYVGAIMLFAGDLPPKGWMFCDGRFLNIAANNALFSVIGTNFGGNGVGNFALPDFRNAVPINAIATASATPAGRTISKSNR